MKRYTLSKKRYTVKRLEEGETKIFLLEKIFSDPTFKWRTKDFMVIVDKKFGIKQRRGVIKHLSELKKLGLVEFNKIEKFYYLPENYKNYAYLKSVDDNFKNETFRLLRFYSENIQKQYLNTIESEALNEMVKKPIWKQLEILSKREVDRSMLYLEGLIRTRCWILLLKDTPLIKEPKYKKLMETGDSYIEAVKKSLFEENLPKLILLHKDKNTPKAVKLVLSYVYNHILSVLKRENYTLPFYKIINKPKINKLIATE